MSSGSAWLRSHPRVAGLIVLALAAALIKWDILDVLSAANRGESVHYYVAPWLLTPMLTFFGLLVALAPRSLLVRFFVWNDRLRGGTETPAKFSPRVFALLLFYFSPGLALFWWMTHTLGDLEYH